MDFSLLPLKIQTQFPCSVMLSVKNVNKQKTIVLNVKKVSTGPKIYLVTAYLDIMIIKVYNNIVKNVLLCVKNGIIIIVYY